MFAEMTTDELKRRLTELVDELCLRSYNEGAATTAASIMRAASAFPGAGHVTISGQKLDVSVNRDSIGGVKRPRAPKGLARHLIDKALTDAEGHGLTTADIQKRASMMDSRINEKTVYNLLRINKFGRYDQHGDHWFLLPGTSSAEEPDEDSSAFDFS